MREFQAILNLSGIGGEWNHQLRAVVELEQEKFVLRIGGFEELHRRLPRLLELGPHAAAGIEHQADGKGSVLARKVQDLLLDLVLEKPEMLFLQACDEAVQRIGNRHVDLHQGGVDAKPVGAQFDTGFGSFSEVLARGVMATCVIGRRAAGAAMSNQNR